MESLSFKQQRYDDRKDNERHHLLNDLELYKRERSAVVNIPQPVGRHLTDVFKQGDAPRKENDGHERPVAAHAGLLQFQVAVPGKSHEDVGANQQYDSIESLHVMILFV